MAYLSITITMYDTYSLWEIASFHVIIYVSIHFFLDERTWLHIHITECCCGLHGTWDLLL